MASGFATTGDQLLPTQFLPSLRGTPSTALALDALRLLLRLYSAPLLGLSSTDHDEFERAFAVQWLTSFIARMTKLGSDDEETIDLVERAASLLAIFSGSSASGQVVRTLQFTNEETGNTFDIQICDGSINSHEHLGAVGMQTWGSALVLSRMIAARPRRFFSSPESSIRILELGAGTGLVSLVLSKVLKSTHIIATDFDSHVLNNLQSNMERNSFNGDTPRVEHLDWRSYLSPSTPSSTPFDIIIGADVVYEPQQSSWLKATVSHHLRRDNPGAVFYLITPIRHTHQAELNSIRSTFPPASNEHGLCTLHEEEVGLDDSDDMQYVLFTIGWVGGLE